MSTDSWEGTSRGDATASRGTSRPGRSKWARRYWGVVYFQRRVMFLALMVWCAAACVVQLSGPRWEAAAAGLACSLIVLWVQGGWVWRRYRRWVV